MQGVTKKAHQGTSHFGMPYASVILNLDYDCVDMSKTRFPTIFHEVTRFQLKGEKGLIHA